MIWSVVASVIGALVSVLLGVMVAKLNGIELHLEKLNGKLFDHVTTSVIHEAGFATQGAQIQSLLETVRLAHERVDRLEVKVQ